MGQEQTFSYEGLTIHVCNAIVMHTGDGDI